MGWLQGAIGLKSLGQRENDTCFPDDASAKHVATRLDDDWHWAAVSLSSLQCTKRCYNPFARRSTELVYDLPAARHIKATGSSASNLSVHSPRRFESGRQHPVSDDGFAVCRPGCGSLRALASSLTATILHSVTPGAASSPFRILGTGHPLACPILADASRAVIGAPGEPGRKRN